MPGCLGQALQVTRTLDDSLAVATVIHGPSVTFYLGVWCLSRKRQLYLEQKQKFVDANYERLSDANK